ncbi:hypothetical protein [Acinetobacter sp. ANC 4173]|uniref:hypothetical protein n=1 Tax=Acinetobacter sp. ANC 4173 TaxID=2529837 RepID=UPI00103AC78A|nr:hypothetical protein [Acinetobacter sp. ANC 4173]TCB76088.1 hypothetical protein E0H94_16480 [Acinetobacter sp. ANC 4173]
MVISSEHPKRLASQTILINIASFDRKEQLNPIFSKICSDFAPISLTNCSFLNGTTLLKSRVAVYNNRRTKK